MARPFVARQRCARWRTGGVAIAGLPLLLLNGCNEAILDFKTKPTSSSSAVTFNAGLMGTGTSGQFLIPLPEELLSSKHDAENLTTSCDCASAQLLDYVDARGRKRCALMLTAHSGIDRSPVDLLVENTVKRKDGSAITVSVLLSEVKVLD